MWKKSSKQNKEKGSIAEQQQGTEYLLGDSEHVIKL